jgi:N-acetylglutamate synthase-like GNAT family acetyltransferase
MSDRANLPVIRRSDDTATSMALAEAAGLEVSMPPLPETALWGAFDGDTMVGTVMLGEWRGLPIVGRIAIAESHRGRGLGGRLLAVCEAEAARRGTDVLWATARAPGFFAAMGYSIVEGGPERELLLSDCAHCDQFGASCRPQAVRRALGP